MYTQKIVDWYDNNIYKKYTLKLIPGYTALIGPNGAGKTTLITQIKDTADKLDNVILFSYSNFTDGGHCAMDGYLNRNNSMKSFIAVATASEGEAIYYNFGEFVSKISGAVDKAANENKTLIITIDAIDSGTSIDKLREYANLFGLIEEDAKHHKLEEIYIIVAVNNYELAKAANDKCLDPRTGKYYKFSSYEEYADWICGYLAKFK